MERIDKEAWGIYAKQRQKNQRTTRKPLKTRLSSNRAKQIHGTSPGTEGGTIGRGFVSLMQKKARVWRQCLNGTQSTALKMSNDSEHYPSSVIILCQSVDNTQIQRPASYRGAFWGHCLSISVGLRSWGTDVSERESCLIKQDIVDAKGLIGRLAFLWKWTKVVRVHLRCYSFVSHDRNTC